MSNPCYRGITLDGQAVELETRRGVIVAARAVEAAADLPRLLPPLVDLQHNGALGFAFNDMRENPSEPLRAVADYLIANGVGRAMITFSTAPYGHLAEAAAALDKALSADAGLSRLFCGIFHEGVFISPDRGWRGGHDPAYILPPDWDRFRRLNEAGGHRVAMVNVAPEQPGAMAFIRRAAAAGLKVSLGHCHPDTAAIASAVDNGATLVTHFANGAAPNIHRFKNPFWGFLDNPGLTLALVGDGFHLPPEVASVVFKVKGPAGCFMVSDACRYSGCAPGRYRRLGGLDCVVEDNGYIHVAGQELLAGSWFQNNRGVEFLVNRAGFDFAVAWRLCSLTPAKAAGIALPNLRVGDEATFVQARMADGRLVIERSVFMGVEYAGAAAPRPPTAPPAPPVLEKSPRGVRPMPLALAYGASGNG